MNSATKRTTLFLFLFLIGRLQIPYSVCVKNISKLILISTVFALQRNCGSVALQSILTTQVCQIPIFRIVVPLLPSVRYLNTEYLWQRKCLIN